MIFKTDKFWKKQKKNNRCKSQKCCKCTIMKYSMCQKTIINKPFDKKENDKFPCPQDFKTQLNKIYIYLLTNIHGLCHCYCYITQQYRNCYPHYSIMNTYIYPQNNQQTSRTAYIKTLFYKC